MSHYLCRRASGIGLEYINGKDVNTGLPKDVILGSIPDYQYYTIFRNARVLFDFGKQEKHILIDKETGLKYTRVSKIPLTILQHWEQCDSRLIKNEQKDVRISLGKVYSTKDEIIKIINYRKLLKLFNIQRLKKPKWTHVNSSTRIYLSDSSIWRLVFGHVCKESHLMCDVTVDEPIQYVHKKPFLQEYVYTETNGTMTSTLDDVVDVIRFSNGIVMSEIQENIQSDSDIVNKMVVMLKKENRIKHENGMYFINRGVS